MVRNILLASVIALGAAGAAQAADGPRLVGGGNETRLVYDDAPQVSGLAATTAAVPRG